MRRGTAAGRGANDFEPRAAGAAGPVWYIMYGNNTTWRARADGHVNMNAP